MQSTFIADQSASNVTPLADAAVRSVVRALGQAVALRGGREESFEEIERIALSVANEATRQYLESDLQARSDAFPDRLLVNGELHKRHQPGEVEYHSLCGPVRVKRYTYRLVSERNGPTVVPLELATRMIKRTTPALAFCVTQGYAKAPIRMLEEDLRVAHRCPPSRSTLERLAKGMGGCVAQDVVALEEVVRACEDLPERAHAISIGLDRTSVPMAEERPPGEEATTRRKPRRKPRVRRAPHPIDVHYRMAYVATFSITDDAGEALVSRRYAATAEEGPDEILGRLMSDVKRALAQERLPIVVVQDGAPEMWNLMRPALRGIGVRKWREVIDRYHASEHMAAALELVERDAAVRRRVFRQWQASLDNSDGSIYRIVRWIEKRTTSRKHWLKVVPHSEYLHAHATRMKYAMLRRDGMPMGSGVTEGACKSLIMMRTKRSGQRWQQDGLAAVLAVRALYQSERLKQVWGLFTHRYHAAIAAAL
jgi:hypothetical protein